MNFAYRSNLKIVDICSYDIRSLKIKGYVVTLWVERGGVAYSEVAFKLFRHKYCSTKEQAGQVYCKFVQEGVFLDEILPSFQNAHIEWRVRIFAITKEHPDIYYEMDEEDDTYFDYSIPIVKNGNGYDILRNSPIPNRLPTIKDKPTTYKPVQKSDFKVAFNPYDYDILISFRGKDTTLKRGWCFEFEGTDSMVYTINKVLEKLAKHGYSCAVKVSINDWYNSFGTNYAEWVITNKGIRFNKSGVH